MKKLLLCCVSFFVLPLLSHAATTTISSNITTNQTWAGDPQLPYIISTTTGSLSVSKTVTVGPGAVFKFEGPTAGLLVSGNLVASGTIEQPIYLTSIKDDAVGGDTNGNGASYTPAAGDWEGVSFFSSSLGTLNNVLIRYAGSLSTTGVIRNAGGTVSVSNCEISHGQYRGLYNSGGTLTVSNSIIYSNSYGVYHSGGTMNISQSDIYNNSLYGMYNSTTATSTVENNFWGDSTGPYHTLYNPSGIGGTTTNYVDFTPWDNRTQLHYLWVDSGDADGDGNTTEIISGVHDKQIRYIATSTSYMPELYGAIATWNTLGAVKISTSTAASAEDVWVLSRDYGAITPWAGLYVANHFSDATFNDTLLLNDYYFSGYTDNEKQKVITHEFGHGLGLWHSYSGNMMFDPGDPLFLPSALWNQDIRDYTFLWRN